MDLKNKIMEDMKEALKKGEKVKLSALRLLLSAIKNAEIEKREPLLPEEIHNLIKKEARKWTEAAADYRRVKNEEMAQNEEEQVRVIESYLPPQLSTDEIEALIDKAIGETGASGLSDLGKVMQIVMPEVKGRADGRVVNELVKKKLSA